METNIEDLDNIIQRAKEGDSKAFDMLYRAYFTPLYRYVFLRMRSKEDTEDVVQDTFYRAYQALPRYEHSKSTMLPYLFTIARNLLINHGKKKRPDVYPAEDIDRNQGDGDASDLARARELKIELQYAMQILSDIEREVIELKFFGERSYQEIAEVLGKREDAIRQHVTRAMKKMREQLNKREK